MKALIAVLYSCASGAILVLVIAAALFIAANVFNAIRGIKLKARRWIRFPVRIIFATVFIVAVCVAWAMLGFQVFGG